MKTLFTTLLFLSSVSAFAASAMPCKNEAVKAAGEQYQAENPGEAFTIRVKYKPAINAKKIHHIIEIADIESGRKTEITVTLNANDCSNPSID